MNDDPLADIPPLDDDEAAERAAGNDWVDAQGNPRPGTTPWQEQRRVTDDAPAPGFAAGHHQGRAGEQDVLRLVPIDRVLTLLGVPDDVMAGIARRRGLPLDADDPGMAGIWSSAPPWRWWVPEPWLTMREEASDAPAE